MDRWSVYTAARSGRLGTRHLYQANPEGLAELRAYLEQFWEGALSGLAEAAEAEQRRLDEHAR